MAGVHRKSKTPPYVMVLVISHLVAGIALGWLLLELVK